MLAKSEYFDLKRRIEGLLETESPTAWQRQFLGDMLHKLERFGPKARLSDRQWQKLRQITGAGISVGSIAQDNRPLRPFNVHEYKQPKVIPRQLMWLLRRFLRDVAFFTAILLIGFTIIIGTKVYNSFGFDGGSASAGYSSRF